MNMTSPGMIKTTYKAFKEELFLEKNADAFNLIVKLVSKGAKAAWEHPKTTLGIIGGTVAADMIGRSLFPALVVANQADQTVHLDSQNSLLNDILMQERIRNIKPRPVTPMYRPIQRPLV